VLVGVSLDPSGRLVVISRGPLTPGPNPSASRSYVVLVELSSALLPESGNPK